MLDIRHILLIADYFLALSHCYAVNTKDDCRIDTVRGFYSILVVILYGRNTAMLCL